MKLIAVLISLAALLTGCGSKQENMSVNSSQTRTESKETVGAKNEATPQPTPTATQTPTPATTADTERPIEFTYLGITSDKEHIRYRIKVNTAKPISQVDLGIKFTDASGKVLDDTTFAWQNIVKSKQQPIEQGKTYDVEDYLPEGATKAEVVLKRVIFKDGGYWSAQ
ncbi:MAG TPA: hypothetical protein VF791_01540 [Pyrinomonadaceae bacterium]